MSHDLDFEPIRGLPGRLPAGESLLWQGAPDLRAMALHVLHVRKVAVYFALLAAWRLVDALRDGASPGNAAVSALPLLGLGAAAAAILFTLAWLMCRTTVYSITSRRVVMRIGVALPITFNLPFAVIGSAGLRLDGAGAGTIALTLKAPNRLAYPVLWPHARPWHLGRAEPALRLVPDAAKVAHLLVQAVAAALPETTEVADRGARAAVRGDEAWPLAPAAA